MRSFCICLAVYCLVLAVPSRAQAVTAVGAAQQQGAAISHRVGGRANVDMRNMRLDSALAMLRREFGVVVTYSRQTVPVEKRVTYSARNISFSEALNAVLRGTSVGAEPVSDGEVALKVLGKGGVGQGIIAGKVTDGKSGKGIAGANVSIDNDSRGAVSDEEGSYRLSSVAAGTHTVTVRLVGYAKQTRQVNVGEGTTVTVDFKLEPSANVLDQIVVTGSVVATELKAVPNAITVITAKQIQDRGITQIDQLFRGDIPGLFSMETGASNTIPGLSVGEVTMFSRGATNISGSTSAVSFTNPIKTYVDGVEMADSKYLSQIDTRSIDRIEIIAGPQASTIYGANAINGVMQIFTKRGSTSRPSIMVSFMEAWVQNNFSTKLSPSHQYSGNASGMDGRLSYNVGSSWDYTGAWSPGKQLQRTSAFGGSRYQISVLSLDVSARQGWTKNTVRGNVFQVETAQAEDGIWRPSSSAGLAFPTKLALSGRTLGANLGYTPLGWWGHTFAVGGDVANTGSLGSAFRYQDPSDTTFSNVLFSNTRISQSYSSTLRFPKIAGTQIMITYGGDRWRNRFSNVIWSKSFDGAVIFPFVERRKAETNSGMYMQGQVSIHEALFLTYGIRADWNPNYGDQATVHPGRYGLSYARDIDTPLGSLSMKLRGGYGRSIKPPGAGLVSGIQHPLSDQQTLNMYGANIYMVLPNPQLGAEFQQGGEGGIELYIGNRASLILTRYNQTVEGLVQGFSAIDSIRALNPGYGPLPAVNCDAASLNPNNRIRSDGYCYYLQSQYVNAASIRNQGWETQGSLTAGPFMTRVTYSSIKSRIIGVTPQYRALLVSSFGIVGAQQFTPGQTFNWVPEHTWAMNLSYARQGTSVSFNINGIGETFRHISNSDLALMTSSSLRLRLRQSLRWTPPSIRYPVARYVMADMNASHRISTILEGMLQVTNLTNHYQNDFTYEIPTIGRSSRVGVRLRW